jgi:uncharacterized tellurite resistance protein B-like protein
MAFVISRADGESREVSGYSAAAPREDVQRFKAAKKQALPPKVDLRRHMTSVEDQSKLSSCVANAVVGAYEYLARRYHGDESIDVSRLFVYYNARVRRGRETIDKGIWIADAIESLREHGACSEETWPYEPELVNERPDEDAYEEASQFLVDDMLRVETKLEVWRQALAEGYPIIFAIKLFNSFGQQKKRGMVSMPVKSEAERAEHGNHAMLCVGYSDTDKMFIVRNSWGERWGDGGYCYIPYDYLMNDRLNHNDSWIIRQVEPLIFDEETWGDEESLLDDMQTVLSEMSDDDYLALLEDLGDVPLETRFAQLMLVAANADGEISDDELDGLTEFLETILETIGSDLSAKKVLRHAKRLIGDRALFKNTIKMFNRHFSKEALAGFADQIAAVAAADGVTEEEVDLLNSLIKSWQIQEFGEFSVEEEEEEDDEEYDEDDEEYDEDDEEE